MATTTMTRSECAIRLSLCIFLLCRAPVLEYHLLSCRLKLVFLLLFCVVFARHEFHFIYFISCWLFCVCAVGYDLEMKKVVDRLLV